MARTPASSPSRSRPTTRRPHDRDEDLDAAGDQGVGDNVYKVSVTANGGDAFVLSVEVTDVDEAGKVSIDQPQPQVGRSLKATGFSDPDEAKDQVISWERGTSAEGPWTDLSITTAAYTPVAADEGNWLRVTYTYNDKFGDGKTVSAVSENAVEAKTKANAEPAFPKEDDSALDGDTTKQDGTTDQPFMRSVAEEKDKDTAIGDPIAATDADNDVLLYSLGGADAACFDIGDRNGQLETAKKLDFDSPATPCSGTTNRSDSNTYVLTVTATDPSSAAKTVHVRVNVTDVNEAPEFDDDSKKLTTVYIKENTSDSALVYKNDKATTPTGSGADADDGNDVIYTASDDDNTGDLNKDTAGSPDSEKGEIAGSDDNEIYFLEGSDADSFELDNSPGNAAGVFLKKKTDTEVDFEDKSSYSLTVVVKTRRTDTSVTPNVHTDKYARVSVTVKVVNDDDDGTVSLTQRVAPGRSFVER